MDPEDFEDQDPRDDQPLASPEDSEDEDVVDEDAPTDEDEPTAAADPDLDALRQQVAALSGERDQFKARWQGMSPRMQQEVEARRRAEEREEALRLRAEQLEQQLAAQSIYALPEEERPAAIQQYQQQVALRQQQEAFRQLQEQDAQRQQVADNLAKLQVIEHFAQQYKVPKEKLSRFNDPYSMQAFAEEYQSLRKTNRKETRKTTRKDRFEGNGNPAPRPQKQPETFEEARKALAKYQWRME